MSLVLSALVRADFVPLLDGKKPLLGDLRRTVTKHVAYHPSGSQEHDGKATPTLSKSTRTTPLPNCTIVSQFQPNGADGSATSKSR